MIVLLLLVELDILFSESSYSSILVIAVPLPLLPIEIISIPLRSGLGGLKSTAICGKINPTDSVIPIDGNFI